MKISGSKQIAQRYVKALFDVASGASAVEAVEKNLSALAAALEGSEEFRRFLGNPLLTRAQQAQAMDALLANVGAHDVTRKFIAMVAAQKRLTSLPEIAAQFSIAAAEARGEMQAELVSSAPLSAAEAAQVAERLAKAYGKKINLALRVDPALLGGIVINVGSQQLDGSLSGKLSRLSQALKAA